MKIFLSLEVTTGNYNKNYIDYGFKQSIDLIFEQVQKEGVLSKELVKKIIEKIVNEYVKLKPTSQEEYKYLCY